MASSYRSVTKIVRGAMELQPVGRAPFKTCSLAREILENGPYLNIDHFVMPNATFSVHPHGGFSAMTYLFPDSRNSFVNRDSFGIGNSIIGPGAFHSTEAGSGIQHEEIPQVPGVECHGLQLFVKLPASLEMKPPATHHADNHQVPTDTSSPGVKVRVIAGSHGSVSAKASLGAPVTLLDCYLDPGATFEHSIPDRSVVAWIFGIKGPGAIISSKGEHAFGEYDSVGTAHDGDAIRVQAARDQPLQFVLGHGKPTGEPVVWGGAAGMPGVCYTSIDLCRHARENYMQGKFGRMEPSPVTIKNIY
eukprot:jgi/Mesvir1/16182/Mv08447-RA.1